MMRHPRQSVYPWLGCCLIVCVPAFAWAQPVDPFGGGAPVDPSDPFGGPTTPAAPSTGTAVPKTLTPATKEDPVVLAIRESNPTTPVELTRAMQAMMNLGRPDVAKEFLTKLLATKPDQNALVAIHDEFGSALFIRLSRYKPLQPEGGQLSKDTLEAAYNYSRDPARLKSLADQVNDSSPTTRGVAVSELKRAGDAAVAPLVQILADPRRAAEHPAARQALVQLGSVAIEPLIGVLEAPDEALRAQVIDVLGRLRAHQALPDLVHPYAAETSDPAVRKAAEGAMLRIVGHTPSAYEAEQYLNRRVKSLLAGEAPRKIDLQGMIELWHWDAGQNMSVPQQYPASAGTLLAATRAARALYSLAPENTEYRRLYLTVSLESAKLIAGLDAPLPRGDGTAFAEASAAGVAVVEDVLSHAIHSNHTPAAIGAAEVLSEIGGDEQVFSEDGRQRPLALALSHSDRRLRNAAAQAILNIDPQQAYPGDSELVDQLAHSIRSRGERAVIVAHPRREHSQVLTGILAQMAMTGDTATTGRELFLMASKGPDYDYLLISDAISQPDANELVQMLRRDPRTAKLPIGLISRQENYQRMQRLAAQYSLTEAFAFPYDAEGLAYVIRQLSGLAGQSIVPPDVKLQHASAALDRLLYLMENKDQYSFYNIMRHQDAVIAAVEVPKLSASAAKLLGILGTQEAQNALVEFASQHTRPITQRQAAAQAFDAAVVRRGTMLTTQQILDQYERYNQSETHDRETQVVLGSILDTIERKKSEEESGSENDE